MKKIKEKEIFSASIHDKTVKVGINGEVYEIPLDNSEIILSSTALKILFNVKEFLRVCKNSGLRLKPPYFDIMIAAYLVNPNKGKYNFDEVVLEHLGKFYDGSESPVNYMLELYEKLSKVLKEKELERLFFDIEMPLIEVLFDMEETGIKVDIEKLENLTKYVSSEIDRIREKNLQNCRNRIQY